jgi:hypothetical protein
MLRTINNHPPKQCTKYLGIMKNETFFSKTWIEKLKKIILMLIINNQNEVNSNILNKKL